jgi:alpha-tubulin suppressor-like RCC1 family protein
VRVTDSVGNTSDAAVTINPVLAISPPTATITTADTKTFTASDGVAPYTFSIVSGPGTVDANTGVVTPTSTGTVIVRVTDSLANTADATLTVNALPSISPTSITLAFGTSYTFTTSGGAGSITYSVTAGSGAVGAATGVYTAPTTEGTETVRATDSLAHTSDATVTVIKPVKIVSGDYHSCALYSDGSVKCWGDNTYGQLGYGNMTNLGDGANEMGGNLAFVNLGTGLVATDLAAGANHTCALFTNGNIKCWGRSQYGQLGYENTNNIGDGGGEMGDSLAYVNVGTGRTVSKLYAGQSETCAILDNNDLKCWGYNNHGQLGQGMVQSIGDQANQMGDNLNPIDLGTGHYATTVAIGVDAICAILENSSVKCWGGNASGQLGHENTVTIGDAPGEMGDALPVTNLGTGRSALKLISGYSHFCALLNNNTVKCWGSNTYGQLGQAAGTSGARRSIGDAAGEMGDNLAVSNVGTGLTATGLIAGQYHTCAILSDSSVKCWGRNNVGQLGRGNTTNFGGLSNQMGDNLAALDFGAGVTATSISAGGFFSCIITTNNRVKCWGGAASGTLGNGSSTSNLGDAAGEMGNSLPYVAM